MAIPGMWEMTPNETVSATVEMAVEASGWAKIQRLLVSSEM